MSKRSWILIAAAVALGVLIGGYFLLPVLKPAPKSTAPALVELAKADPDSLVRIELTDRAEGRLVAERKGKDWTIPAAPAAVLDPASMEGLAVTFTMLTAQGVIDENPTDLAQFGLNPPKARGTGTFKDGQTTTFLLGDSTPSGDAWYIQKKGDPKVYSVWSSDGERLHLTLGDLRDKKIAPVIKPEDVASLTLKLRGGAAVEIRKKGDQKEYTHLSMGPYVMTRPWTTPRGLASDKQQQVLGGPSVITISEFVDDAPRSLAKYGLAKPWGEAIVKSAGGDVLDFLFGDDRDANSVYFAIRGRPGVYTVSKSLLSFMDVKPFDLVDKFVFIPNIDDVDAIEVSAGTAKHAMKIVHTVTKAQGTDEQDEDQSTFFLDGRQAESGAFRGLYQSIIGLLFDGEAKKSVANAPEVTVRFSLNKGEPRSYTVTYAPYDRDFYAVFINGKCDFAIVRQQIDGMLAKIAQFDGWEKAAN